MNTKKMLALAMCAVLLVVSTVFVTVAFLTSQDAVQNTFTVGNVVITLDELDVDNDANTNDNVTYGEGENAVVRDQANAYKLIPGKSYVKDPIVHVKGNEACYLFIKVKNEIAGIEAATTIENQILANGWQKHSVDGNTTVYYYGAKNDPTAVAANTDVPTFASFKVADDVTNDVVATYEGKAVDVTAYAIQADGLEDETPAELWNKLVG
ncbi:MAG: hypothetical protein IKU53_03275 [Firmicutes bacterium]|nr:hypothetical protein [Bacillota bacterium]